MKKIIAIIIMLLSLTMVHAQERIELSLQQAIQYGLANNKTIQASGLETALVRYKAKEYQSSLYPIITGNAGATHYVDIPVQYVSANTFDATGPSDQYLGFKLLLPNTSDVGLAANWLLYDQAIYSALKQAKATYKLSDIQYQKDKSELALNISQLYYGIIFARKQQESLFKIDSNTTRLVDALQAQYDNGLIKRSDLDKVKVNKVTAESRIDQINAVITTQANILKLLTGLPQTTQIELAQPAIEQLLIPIIEPSDAENNFDLQILRQQITISLLERKTIIAGYFPSLSANYNYSYNWTSANLDNLIGSKFRYPQQYVGINISVPIFDGNRNLYKLKQNAISTKQLQLREDFLRDRTNTDISNAQLSYNTSLKNMSANNANVSLAENLYAENLYQYQQGTISLNDVLTTENALQQALTEYFGSMSKAFTALLEYKKATNTILINK